MNDPAPLDGPPVAPLSPAARAGAGQPDALAALRAGAERLRAAGVPAEVCADLVREGADVREAWAAELDLVRALGAVRIEGDRAVLPDPLDPTARRYLAALGAFVSVEVPDAVRAALADLPPAPGDPAPHERAVAMIATRPAVVRALERLRAPGSARRP